MAEWTPQIRKVTGNEQERILFAGSLIREKRYDQALAELQDVLNVNEDSYDANLAMGRLYQAQQQHQKAIPHITRAMELDPLQPTAALMAGLSFAGLKDFDQAGAAFETSIKLDPKLCEAYMGLAFVCQNRRDDEQAIANLKEALKLDPQLVVARIFLARLYAKTGKTDAAIEELEGILQRNPGQRAASIMLALIFAQQEKHEAVAEILAAAIEKSPEDAVLWNVIARARLRQEDYVGAEEACREAGRLQPKRPDVSLRLVSALIPQEKFDEAQTILETMPRLRWLAVPVQKHYGDIYSGKKMFKEAATSYRAAILQGPSGQEMLAEIGEPEEGAPEADLKALTERYRSALEGRMEKTLEDFAKVDWQELGDRFMPGFQQLLQERRRREMI